MVELARISRFLRPNEIIRYAGLCIALLSSVLMLFVFKRTLSDAATAFLLSAFGTSGFAIFASFGFGKPLFQRLARQPSAHEQALATTFLCGCALGGAILFSALWWLFGNPPEGLSTLGAMSWIASYALTAAIQSVRDLAYLAGKGPAFEKGEFLRRVGAMLAICLLYVDKTCLLSGLVYLTACLGSNFVIFRLLVSQHTKSPTKNKASALLNLLRHDWRAAFRFQIYSACELGFYAGPYFVLNAVGSHESVLLYAYFQRLFQGITTFTRVPVDVGIYGVLNLARVDFQRAAQSLVFRSLLIATPIIVMLAVLWGPVAEVVVRQMVPWSIFAAVAIWVSVNCILHFYGSYINLKGDYFFLMTKVSLVMAAFLLLTVWGGETWMTGIGESLVISGAAYGVMALAVRSLAYRKVMENI
jgi:hypothetical protein